MDTVLMEKHDGYAVITLNRPDALNALSRALRADLAAALEDCKADGNIRVIVLTGAGRAFCAGLDLKELGDDQADVADDVGSGLVRVMESFEGPIIGAINGHAVTGGFEVALACDVLIASENARFADTHGRVGLLPGWGLSQKLPRLIGMSRAKEISFTGNPVFAQQALEWGLVNHVVPADELLPKAIEMAQAMCALVPEVLLGYKRLMETGASMPYAEALAWEEQESIDFSRGSIAATVAERRDAVIAQGRQEKSG